MDIIDRAAEYEEMERLAAIERARRMGVNPSNNSENCTDCGDPIPQARRAANPHTCRCIECQHYHEKQQKTRSP